MRTRQTLSAYIALASSMIIWGFSFLAIKDLMGLVPVFSLLFVRFTIAALLLGGLAVARRAIRLPRRDLLVLAGLSALSPVGYFLFETYGIAFTQPSHVAVIIATIPIAVFLIALVRRQETITWRKAAGILVAYGGILLIIGFSQSESGASLFGDLLVLGAVACASARTSLIKDALRRITPLQLTFYQFFFSLAVFGPLALATDDFSWIGRLQAIHIAEILFLAILCSAVAFLAMHYALSKLSAIQVSVAANLVPVITLLAEVALFGSLLTWPKAIGTVLAILGVTLTQLRQEPRRPLSVMEGA